MSRLYVKIIEPQAVDNLGDPGLCQRYRVTASWVALTVWLSPDKAKLYFRPGTPMSNYLVKPHVGAVVATAFRPIAGVTPRLHMLALC